MLVRTATITQSEKLMAYWWELWCDGGELGFIRRMIAESAKWPGLCRWFTTLVSKGTHVTPLLRTLESVPVTDVRILELTHGQKQSRILAWAFR